MSELALGTVLTGYSITRGTAMCWCDWGIVCMFCPYHFLYDPDPEKGDWMDEWSCPVCGFLTDEDAPPSLPQAGGEK